MKQFIATINLMHGTLPISIFAISALCLAVLLITKPKKSKYFPKLLTQLGSAFLFAIIFGFITWLISDVFLVFGVSLGWLVIFSIAGGFAAVGFALSAAIISKGYRRAFAIFSIILFVLATMIRVNMIYGEYTTIGSVFGLGNYPKLEEHNKHNAVMEIKDWNGLADQKKLPKMPSKGISRSVRIPATQSNFRARIANVYLPPAALTKFAPKLPVMVLLSGQPGSPNRLFAASEIVNTLDAYAKKHNGLAPIVVSPDQNGTSTHNSLCANTKVYGNAQTYLTKDVVNWIRKNLPASTNPALWLMGGFSQGGTCATQIVPAYPKLFGNMYSAGGELEPTYKNKNETINRYFNGNRKEYEKHIPANIMRKNAPLNQNYYSIAGAWDPKSQINQSTIAIAAHKAGISVITMISKGSGHDWHTVQSGLKVAIDHLCKDAGIVKHDPDLSSYSNIQVVVNQKVRR